MNEFTKFVVIELCLLFLALFIIFFGLTSCFVSGRTIQVHTPRVEVSADTATAYTWPYNTKFQ